MAMLPRLWVYQYLRETNIKMQTYGVYQTATMMMPVVANHLVHVLLFVQELNQ